jgi:hypothetical protein
MMWPFKPTKQPEPEKPEVEQWTRVEKQQLKELGLDKPSTMIDINRAFLKIYKKINSTNEFSIKAVEAAENAIVSREKYFESKAGLVDKLDREVGERARAYEALEKRVEELERTIQKKDTT